MAMFVKLNLNNRNLDAYEDEVGIKQEHLIYYEIYDSQSYTIIPYARGKNPAYTE